MSARARTESRGRIDSGEPSRRDRLQRWRRSEVSRADLALDGGARPGRDVTFRVQEAGGPIGRLDRWIAGGSVCEPADARALRTAGRDLTEPGPTLCDLEPRHEPAGRARLGPRHWRASSGHTAVSDEASLALRLPAIAHREQCAHTMGRDLRGGHLALARFEAAAESRLAIGVSAAVCADRALLPADPAVIAEEPWGAFRVVAAPVLEDSRSTRSTAARRRGGGHRTAVPGLALRVLVAAGIVRQGAVELTGGGRGVTGGGLERRDAFVHRRRREGVAPLRAIAYMEVTSKRRRSLSYLGLRRLRCRVVRWLRSEKNHDRGRRWARASGRDDWVASVACTLLHRCAPR